MLVETQDSSQMNALMANATDSKPNASIGSLPGKPTDSSVPFSLKLTLVLLPVVAYGLALGAWGFSGVTRAIDGPDASDLGASVFVHAAPIIWLMFSPLFLVPGIVRRSPLRVRDWFTSELSRSYGVHAVSWAAGAHLSTSFDVRDIDEKVIATGKTATAPLPGRMQLSVGESHYDAVLDWANDPAENGWTDHRGRQLRVVRRDANPDHEAATLLTYFASSRHGDPALIVFNGAPDLWLKPNPPCAFPRSYDMLVEESVVGKVEMPGKMLFQGVMVVSEHYPAGVRAVIAAACYQMMRS